MAVIDDAERLMERQLGPLQRANGVESLYLVTPYIRALTADPFIRPILADLRDQAGRDVGEFFSASTSARRLTLRAGEILFNAAAARNDPKLQERMIAVETLGQPLSVTMAMDRPRGVFKEPISYAADLLAELFHDMATARQIDAQLISTRRSLTEATGITEAALAVLNIQLRRPAFSFIRLLAASQHLPETQTQGTVPFAVTEEQPLGQVTANIQVVPLLVGADLTSLLAHPDQLARHASARELADSLRDDLIDLHEELLFRLGGVRSRRALIDRYVARCERYGRQRLLDLAQENTNKAEALLRDDLALYLFDNGLDPLTETALTTTRSDLLELSDARVLVEAKQYAAGARASLTGLIRGAYRQTVDTTAELRPRQAAEAFVVVYRRGGSRLVLPEDPVRLGETNYFFRLVDLTPASQTGSGARDPVIELTADDITQAVRKLDGPSAA